MLKNVVLPAPLGPMSETIAPRGMSKSTELTASRPPNRLVTFLRWAGVIVNPPINAVGDAIGLPLLEQFDLVNYNFLIFGVVLAIMMIRRPEGLFPVESHKAELHGIGVAAEVTAGSDDELAAAEEVEQVELESPAGVTLDEPTDTPEDQPPDEPEAPR